MHTPAQQGLYDPRFEHDACGVGFVADMHGRRSHEIVRLGLSTLCNLDHRGATNAEENVGDGAGILVQVPDAFLRAVCDFDLPAAGAYACGIAFLPAEDPEAAATHAEKLAADEGLVVLGWRDVPVDDSMIGSQARDCMPVFRMLLVAGAGGESGIDLDRLCFVARKRMEHEIDVAGGGGLYFSSLSARTLVFKGMLVSGQVQEFFTDLDDERLDSAIALVHSRFSTNTFPSWPLAHPYRFVAHNGEINTVRGNENWLRAREALMRSPHLPGLERAFPVCTPDSSDTCRFDEALELLHLGGRPLPHAVLMMIPEAWENHETMPDDKRAFYEFHSSLMEPWDGPASVAFTDGTVIGAVLDRNGLRPSRYWVTDDGLVIMASEVGVIEVPAHKVVQKGRLRPGRMFLVDTAQGRIVGDDEIKSDFAAEHPYGEWLQAGLVHLSDLPERHFLVPKYASITTQQRTFGYTLEDEKVLLGPMARTGAEPIGSMGTDTPGRGALGATPAALRLLPAALRPGHQPAARRHPRGAGHQPGVHHRARGQPPRPHPGELPAGRTCPRRSSPTTSSPSSSTSTTTATTRASAPSPSTACSPSPRAARACAGRSRRSAPRCRPPSPRAPRSSSSRTATRTRSWRPSRRCCSPRRSTTT